MFDICVFGTKEQAEELLQELIKYNAPDAYLLTIDQLSTLGLSITTIQDKNGDIYSFKYFSTSQFFESTRLNSIKNADMSIACNSDAYTTKALEVCCRSNVPAIMFTPNTGINFWDQIKAIKQKSKTNTPIYTRPKTQLFPYEAQTMSSAPQEKSKRPESNSATNDIVFESKMFDL